MNKLVSVIIPTYNRKEKVIKAIDSVLNQTYKNIEIIVVDDCSLDETESEIKRKYEFNKKVIYYRLESNSGACAARNKGIDISNGELISFLDSDDEYYPDKIEKQVYTIENDKSEICCTSFYRKEKNGEERIIHVKKGSKKEIISQLLYSNFITTGTILGYKRCFEKNKFNETIKRFQDWELILRLSKKYKISLIEEPLLIQNYQAQSITSTTNHENSYKSLLIIFNNNKELYKNDKRAQAQIKWVMAMHLLYFDRRKATKCMYSSATVGGFKVKKFMAYIMIKMHIIKPFLKKFDNV